MNRQKELDSFIKQQGFTDFHWINPSDIVIGHWVRMKCRFGCNDYGKTGTCPPNVPDVEECRNFFKMSIVVR